MTHLKVGGPVWVAPVGTEPSDPGWRSLGGIAPGSVAFGHDGSTPKKLATSHEFTFNMKPHSLDALALYYGTYAKSAGTANNRGGARKEEKHMGAAREFRDEKGDRTLSVQPDRVQHTQAGGGVHLDIIGRRSYGWFEKADVPLIAHALFEKSGWPDAVQGGYGTYKVTIDGGAAVSWSVGSNAEADKALAEAVANLAAYNAWVEGSAARLEAEVAAEAARVEAEERRAAENARKREHDALRTSAIALEALEIYNEDMGARYSSWDAVNFGKGTDDADVRYWIDEAEAARAFKAAALAPLADWERELLEGAKPAPKVGDRVRVSADAKMSDGFGVYFGEEVEGAVVGGIVEGNILVQATTASHPCGIKQYVDPKYVTILATAEDLAAEKAKAERDAEIAAIQEHIGSRVTAECMHAEGFRLIK